MRPPFTALALAAAMFLAAPLSAHAEDESLASIAKKTKREREERRARSTKPVRSFSDDDLGGSGPVATQAATEASDAGAQAKDAAASDGAGKDKKGGAPEKTDAELRAEARGEIQKKIDAERQRMQQMDEVISEAQKELSDITSFTYGSRRAGAQKALDDAQAEKARAQQAIEGLQEEARRLGVSVSQ
jgi:hypothetical protein